MKTKDLIANLEVRGFEVVSDGLIMVAKRVKSHMIKGTKADFRRGDFTVVGEYIVCTKNAKVVDTARS